MEIPPSDDLPSESYSDDRPPSTEGGYVEDTAGTEDDACDADFLPGGESAEIFDDIETGADTAEYGVFPGSERTPEAIQAACEADVQHAVTAAVREPEATQQMTVNADAIAIVAVDQIKDAVADDNMAEVGACIQYLDTLPSISEEIRTEGYYTAALYGDQQGLLRLRSMLLAEKNDALGRRQQLTVASAGTLDPINLRTVVELCAAQGVSADGWIDEFAFDDMHRWQLRMLHASDMAGTEAAGMRQRVDDIALELCQPGAFPPDFVFTQVAGTLREVGDLDVRAELVDAWHSVVPPPNLKNYQALIRTAGAIGRDPLLNTSENNARIEDTIQNATQQMQAQGYELTPLEVEQLPWEMQQIHNSGIQPQDVIGLFDRRVSQLYTELALPGRSGTPDYDRQILLEEREYTIEAHAEQYATEGAFTAAKVMLSYLTANSLREQGYKQCLAQARTPQDVDAMRPDEAMLGLDTNPNIALWFRFADARLSGEQGVLPALARDCAEAITDEPDDFDDNGVRTESAVFNDHKRNVIELAFDQYAVKYPEDAPALAADLLTVLRQKGERYPDLAHFSDALIDSGDPVEPAHAYNDIERSSADPSRLLLQKWQLARRIAGK